MASPGASDERHMSDAEALMWNLEKDPMLRSAFANVTVLDRPPDLRRIRARMDQVVRAFPRLRRRVEPTFGRLAPPRWADDPTFDLDAHVRRLGVGGAGTERDLLDLAAQLIEDPFDRTRPLWRFWLIDGLEGGRGAVVQQLHHTITDGEGGVRLSAMILDLERDATQPIVPLDVDDEGRSVAGGDGDAAGEPSAVGGLLAGSRAALEHNLRRQVGIARRLGGETVHALRHPGELPERAAEGIDVARSVGRQAFITDRAHSPLWVQRSLSRRIETLRVPFDDAHRAAKDLGGTLNDLFVTAAAAGAGAYHRVSGAPVDELRISMPVSVRAKGQHGGNAFSPTRVLVPTGELEPAERFRRVQEVLAGAKGERAISVAQGLAGVLNLLPTSLLVEIGRRQVQTVDFAVSNVRGAPFDLYLGGGKILANYPIGPTAGTAWNLTLLSASGMLDMGLNVDTAAVAEPELLRDEIALAFDELLVAGGGPAAPGR